MSGFEARYPGRCGGCDEQIKVGDWLIWSEDDSVVHADCEATDSGRVRTSFPVCPRCYMETAANGLCGCDE